MAALSKPIGQETLPQQDWAPEIGPEPPPLTRLARLHEEAAETAELANLLGRTLYAIILLPLLALPALIASSAPGAQRAGWCAFVLLASAALYRVYAHAMKSPFDRETLRSFAEDLNAVMLFAGFAWGAGAFLVLSSSTEPAFAVLFSAGAATLLTSVVRIRKAVLYFAVPAALMTAGAALLRPLALAPVTACLVLVTCAFVAFAVMLSDRMRRRADVNPYLIPGATTG
jgi:hypothetical protein